MRQKDSSVHVRSLLLSILILFTSTANADPAQDAAEMARDAVGRGFPLAALFHAARAKELGADVSVDRVDVDALWSELATRPSVAVPESCAWMRAPLEEFYPAARANVQVAASLTCEADGRTWPENQDYTWYENVERVESRTTPPTQTYVSSMCKAATSGDWSQCGHWETTPGTTENVTVKDQVPHTGNHDVIRQQLSIKIVGRVSSPSGNEEVDLQRAIDEVQFSDEHGSQSFTTSAAGLRGDGVTAVRGAVQLLIMQVRHAQRDVELRAAESAGDKLAAEEHSLRAWTLGDPAAAVAAAYGLTNQELATLLATAGLETPWELQVDLYKEKQARDAQYVAPSGPSVLERFASAGTKLTLERTTRVGDDRTSLGVGVRIDHGWRLRKIVDYSLGLSAGAGNDEMHGSRYDARGGLALGLGSERSHLAYVVGLGYAGSGVRAPGAVASALESKPDVFHGVDFRLRVGPIGLDGRLFKLLGGALGDELRFSTQVLVGVGRVLFGIEGSVSKYEGVSDTVISALGLTIGIDRPRGSRSSGR